METKIKNIIICLRVLIFSVWLAPTILFVMHKVGLLSFDGNVAPQSTGAYIFECICIACVLVGVPLAMKLFTLNTTKNLRRMNFDEALQSYMTWGIIRMSILVSTAFFCVISYLLTSKMSCGVCCLIAMVASLLCYPTKDKIKYFLENQNIDQD